MNFEYSFFNPFFVKTEVMTYFFLKVSSGLSAVESIAANGDTIATRWSSTVAATAATTRTSRWTVLTAATARLATTDADVTTHINCQTVITAPTSTSASRLSSDDTFAITI
jgi:hypothetical protein